MPDELGVNMTEHVDEVRLVDGDCVHFVELKMLGLLLVNCTCPCAMTAAPPVSETVATHFQGAPVIPVHETEVLITYDMLCAAANGMSEGTTDAIENVPSKTKI